MLHILTKFFELYKLQKHARAQHIFYRESWCSEKYWVCHQVPIIIITFVQVPE